MPGFESVYKLLEFVYVVITFHQSLYFSWAVMGFRVLVMPLYKSGSLLVFS